MPSSKRSTSASTGTQLLYLSPVFSLLAFIFFFFDSVVSPFLPDFITSVSAASAAEVQANLFIPDKDPEGKWNWWKPDPERGYCMNDMAAGHYCVDDNSIITCEESAGAADCGGNSPALTIPDNYKLLNDPLSANTTNSTECQSLCVKESRRGCCNHFALENTCKLSLYDYTQSGTPVTGQTLWDCMSTYNSTDDMPKTIMCSSDTQPVKLCMTAEECLDTCSKKYTSGCCQFDDAKKRCTYVDGRQTRAVKDKRAKPDPTIFAAFCRAPMTTTTTTTTTTKEEDRTEATSTTSTTTLPPVKMRLEIESNMNTPPGVVTLMLQKDMFFSMALINGIAEGLNVKKVLPHQIDLQKFVFRPGASGASAGRRLEISRDFEDWEDDVKVQIVDDDLGSVKELDIEKIRNSMKTEIYLDSENSKNGLTDDILTNDPNSKQKEFFSKNTRFLQTEPNPLLKVQKGVLLVDFIVECPDVDAMNQVKEMSSKKAAVAQFKKQLKLAWNMEIWKVPQLKNNGFFFTKVLIIKEVELFMQTVPATTLGPLDWETGTWQIIYIAASGVGAFVLLVLIFCAVKKSGLLEPVRAGHTDQHTEKKYKYSEKYTNPQEQKVAPEEDFKFMTKQNYRAHTNYEQRKKEEAERLRKHREDKLAAKAGHVPRHHKL